MDDEFPYKCPFCEGPGPENDDYWEVFKWVCPRCGCTLHLMREVTYHVETLSPGDPDWDLTPEEKKAKEPSEFEKMIALGMKQKIKITDFFSTPGEVKS